MPYVDEKALAELEQQRSQLSAEEYEAVLTAKDLDYKPRTKDELADLASRIFKGETVARWITDANSVHMFVPLMLMERSTVLSLLKMHVLLYADMREAAPRAVNGMPMFFSVSYVSYSEGLEVVSLVERMEQAMAQILGGSGADHS